MHKLPPEAYKYILTTLAITFGAIVHATSQFKIADNKDEPYTKIDFLVNFTIALFAGGVFGLFSSLFFPDDKVIILFSAVGAFLGLAGLNKFATGGLEFVLSKLKK